MCLVIPATHSLFILCSLGATVIALGGLSEVQITKCENAMSLCTLEGTNTRASGIRDCFPYLLRYQEFWSINSRL